MSLLFIEGFDSYATVAQLQRKWFQVPGYTYFEAGRYSGNRISFERGTLILDFGGTNQDLIVGAAVMWNSFGSNADFMFYDVGTAQIGYRRSLGSGLLSILRGGTVVATSTRAVQINKWYYIELKVHIANSGGTVEVKVNGEVWVSFNGDTQNSANAQASRLNASITYSNQRFNIDDLYICNTSGTYNNDYLGDCKVVTLRPIDDGATTEWTPITGSNYENIDDETSDDDTTYNSTSGTGNIDLFDYEDVSGSMSIFGVQQSILCRKDDAGAREIKQMCRSGGTNYLSDAKAITDDYLFYMRMDEVDPDTDALWSVTGVSTGQWGIEMES